MSSLSNPTRSGTASWLLAVLVVLASALAILGTTAATASAETTMTSAWDQPALSNPITITISDTNRTLNLSSTQDYIIQCPAGVVNLSGKITVWGGHNVVFQDCDENVTNPSGDWAGDFQDQTGTLWIHDVHFGGVHLTGGIQLQEPGATVVLRDVLFDQVNGSYTTNHAECIQTWSGPAQFLIDGLTCATTYQGLFLLPNQDGGATPTDWDLRNIDVHGDGAYDLWLGDVGPNGAGQLPEFNVQNVYDCDPTNPRTYDGTSDGGVAWAAVQGCPTPTGSTFVSATSYGATGPDDPAYQDTITGDDPLFYWQLNDTAGSSATAAAAGSGSAAPATGSIATDDEGADEGTYGAGVTLGAPGPLPANSTTAVALDSRGAQIQTANPYPAPSQYTVEAWFNVQPGSGDGQIVGLNANQNGSGLDDDHSVYLDQWGHVDCYFWSNGVYRLVSPNTYTDGQWHLVQCAKGPSGMTLDIDGQLVASNTFTGPTYPYSGYWAIGDRPHAGDGPRQSILGEVGQVAIYGYALSQAQDANHWAVGQGQPSAGS
jgi:Concanavalin A-like lectin/glucanases superfamily